MKTWLQRSYVITFCLFSLAGQDRNQETKLKSMVMTSTPPLQHQANVLGLSMNGWGLLTD